MPPPAGIPPNDKGPMKLALRNEVGLVKKGMVRDFGAFRSWW